MHRRRGKAPAKFNFITVSKLGVDAAWTSKGIGVEREEAGALVTATGKHRLGAN